MTDLESTVRARLHDLADDAPSDDAEYTARAARGRYRQQRRQRLAVAGVCAALLVVGGGSTAAVTLLTSASADRGADTADRPLETPSTPPPPIAPTPTPAPAPEPTPAPEPSPAPAPTTAPVTSVPPPTPIPTPPPAPAVVWPDEAVAQHGGRYWSVVLAVGGPADDPAVLQGTYATLQAHGYSGGIGSIGCSDGATAALGLDPATVDTVVDVYFGTEEEARRFAALYEPGVLGVAPVTAYCLD